MTYNEVSLEYSDQAGNPITFNKLAVGTRELTQGSTVPLYYDPNKPIRMGLDLDAVAAQPRTDRFRQYFSQAGGVLFVVVGIATMLFLR